MNVEPYFSQQSSYRQPSSQPVDDWNSADLALAPALNDANWQYDAMAWDIAPQEIGIQGMQDVSTEPWRTDAGCMNVDGGGGGGGSSVDRQ